MATSQQDHYKVLGVAETATDDDIRRAYKRLALKWHPDKNPDDIANAEVMFKKIAVAYKVLKEPADRRQYDEKVRQQSQQQQQQQQQQEQQQQRQPSNCTPAAPQSTAVQPRQGLFGSISKAVGSVSERFTASRQAAREREEAYNLFEEVFGKDPFKEVDSLFQDPSQERLDSFFSSISQNAKQMSGNFQGQTPPKHQHGSVSQTNQHIIGSSTSTSSTMVFGPQGMFCRTQDSQPQLQQPSPANRSSPSPPPVAMSACHSQPPGHHPQPALPGSGMGPSQSMPAGHLSASKCFRARCLAPNGVAFRRSAQVGDRLPDVRGPGYGDVLVMVDPPYKDWVRCAKGWLPLALNGMAVVEVFPPNCTLRARCIAPQGVGYRACMDLDNRLFNVRGPNSGDIVEVEELLGSWIRTPSGWLPIFIGGQVVMELLGELSPESLQASIEAAHRRAVPQTPQEAPSTGRPPSRQSWSPWSAPWFSSWSLAGLLWPSGPKLQVALVTVVGSSCYIGFKSFVFVLKTWKRAAFGWLF